MNLQELKNKLFRTKEEKYSYEGFIQGYELGCEETKLDLILSLPSLKLKACKACIKEFEKLINDSKL